MEFTEKELVTIAKRENNNKRNYLVLNRLQGKHIPVSPTEAFGMFDELANQIKGEYQNETLLLIGFAETATAIGSELAIQLDTYYMQTTREDLEGVEYLYFSESHSHATEQKIVKSDMDQIIPEIDRIVFVEDEVTTGNTILNIIHIIENEYSKKIRFSVASLLNGMNAEAMEQFAQKEIQTHYLVKTSHEEYPSVAAQYRGDGRYQDCCADNNGNQVSEIKASACQNARRLTSGPEYLNACERLWNQVKEKVDFTGKKNILVMGTEEFMFPALYLGKKLEEYNHKVKSCSTTRSPIAVSSEAVYPLHVRYELKSFYDEARITYIYDLKAYDEVFIVTDAANEIRPGLHSLVNALCTSGNRKISLIRWC